MMVGVTPRTLLARIIEYALVLGHCTKDSGKAVAVDLIKLLRWYLSNCVLANLNPKCLHSVYCCMSFSCHSEVCH